MNDEKVLNVLSALSDSINSKETYLLNYELTNSDSVIRFDKVIELNPKRNYHFYLKMFSTYNTLFNIDETNNKFYYTIDNTVPANNNQPAIVLTPGAYSIDAINIKIQAKMKERGHYNTTTGVANPYYVTITMDETTSKTVLSITNPRYSVDFSEPNTMRDILGFRPILYSGVENISEEIIKIVSVNNIYIHCDWVSSNSYLNGKMVNILYAIPAYTIGIGAKLAVSEINPLWLPLTRKSLDSIRFQIKDANGKLLNFNNEIISIQLVIQQI